MRARILKFVQWFLLIWGSLSFAATIALGVFVAYQLGVANRDRNDTASPHDVRYVLNWCHLGEDRIERVVHSHISARSFTGDHLDAFAIKISHVDEADFTSKTNDAGNRWYRGDQLPPVVDAAVKFITAWHHEIPWFPTEAELRNADVYVYPWSIYCYGVEPSAAELIFVRKSDQMVFFFSGKT